MHIITTNVIEDKSIWAFKKRALSDFFLVFILVCVSGNMFFLAGDRDVISLPAFAVLVSILIWLRSISFNRMFLAVIFVFVIIFASQTISFSFFPMVTIAGFFVKLFIAYGVMRLVDDFAKTFVFVMVFVSLLSFVFYIPDRVLSLIDIDIRQLFIPFSEYLNVQTLGVNERINIGVYNFQVGEHAGRNAAFFWEPGAFAGYLLLAIIFLSFSRSRLSVREFRGALFLFIVAILTTQSTTGIVVLPFALFLFLELRFVTLLATVKSSLIMFAIAIFLLFFIFIAAKIDFVGGKISYLYTIGVNQEAGWHLSRFGSMIFDAEYIQARPLTGWGQNDATQYQLHEDLERFALGNGMTGFVRQMGFLGMGVFLSMLWLGLRGLEQSKSKSMFIIFIVLLTLNGEYFLMYPLFMGLMFLSPLKDIRNYHRYGNYK